ncbi:MAG TPA: hypothetical protein VJJ80_01735 [Patescibacteria group bacterium]|nr:hypothetical protein [Patescibacteria group bacterium]
MPKKNSSQKDKLDQLLAKVSKMKKEQKLDLSSDQDLSIAVMNLVSIEEHFFFTAEKTGKAKYLKMLNLVREMRKELLKKLVKNPEGEIWCLSKHLLAAAMRLMEVGTKAQTMGKDKEAEDYFSKSYQLYSLFWGLNMGAIDVAGISKIGGQALNVHDKSKKGVLGKMGDLVKKVIDCCIE